MRKAWLGLGAVSIALVLAGLLVEDPTPSAETHRASPQQARSEVAAIYSALDRRDASAIPRVLPQLSSEDPSLRLAALRLVAQLDASPHTSELLPLLEDPDDRVRRAAIQLATRLRPSEPGLRREVTARLLAVATSPERDLGDRLLALTSLEGHSSLELRRLLPLLDDPRLASHAGGLLEGSLGRVALPLAGESLRQAWTRELGAGA